MVASVDELRLSCSLRPQKIAQNRTRRTNSPLFRSALMLSRGGVESLKDILRSNPSHIQLSCTRTWATNTSSVEYLILLFILFVGPGQYALLRSKVEPVILSEADLIRVNAGQGFCFSLPGSGMPSQPWSKAARLEHQMVPSSQRSRRGNHPAARLFAAGRTNYTIQIIFPVRLGHLLLLHKIQTSASPTRPFIQSCSSSCPSSRPSLRSPVRIRIVRHRTGIQST